MWALHLVLKLQEEGLDRRKKEERSQKIEVLAICRSGTSAMLSSKTNGLLLEKHSIMPDEGLWGQFVFDEFHIILLCKKLHSKMAAQFFTDVYGFDDISEYLYSDSPWQS